LDVKDLLSIAHQDILNKKIHVKKLQENVQEDINLLEKNVKNSENQDVVNHVLELFVQEDFIKNILNIYVVHVV